MDPNYLRDLDQAIENDPKFIKEMEKALATRNTFKPPLENVIFAICDEQIIIKEDMLINPKGKIEVDIPNSNLHLVTN